jgi:hypothetical protein
MRHHDVILAALATIAVSVFPVGAQQPGEWQTYDIVWIAPSFNADSSLKTPARVTVFFNGVLVQNDSS